MKTIVFSFFFLFCSFFSFGQIVNIPDANMLNNLLNYNCTILYSDLNQEYTKIDKNNDGLIQQSEADDVKEIDFSLCHKITPIVGSSNVEVNSSGQFEFYFNVNTPEISFENYDNTKIYTQEELQNLISYGKIYAQILYVEQVESLDMNDISSLSAFKNLEIVAFLSELFYFYG